MKKIFTLFAALMMVFSMNAATKTIYCKMAQSWWKADGAAVGAYYWGTGSGPAWPGVRMTPVSGETDLWSIDIDTDKFQNIIFTRVNGSGTVSDWGAKTADLTVPTDDKNLYTITSTSPVWGSPGVAGNWSVYAPDAPKTYKDITITVVANATPKIHYWEGGDKVVDTEWDAKPDMVATGEENTYSYTIKEVDEATGVKYLVVVGDVQSADQQAFENVTANFKEILPQVVVMGVTGWTGDVMTVADDYLSASVTLTLEAVKDYDLKLTVNGEWFGSDAITITKDNNSALFADNGDGTTNAKLTIDLAGDYVFTYIYATKTLVVTYPETPVEPEEPVYEVYEVEINDLSIDLDNLILYGSASADFDVEVMLGLGESDLNTGIYQLKPESYVGINGSDATFVEGTAYEIDAFAPAAKAVVRCIWNGMNIELQLNMSAAPLEATVVVVENANVAIEKYLIFGDMYDYALKMTGVWTNEGVDYPVLVEVPVYYPEATEASTIFSTVTVGDLVDENGPWLGFGEGDLTIETVDGVVTATGVVQNPMVGIAIDITISGTLPQGPTGVENNTINVKAMKVIRDGQLIIRNNGVEFNAQGAIVK